MAPNSVTVYYKFLFSPCGSKSNLIYKWERVILRSEYLTFYFYKVISRNNAKSM